ncbi:TTC28 [Branchiostoma lanceolatum]|uniref:TTC28 protein n=1 Tax=Branchiostoma lanceolatum TaxID=7740 RepID=A0A8K0ETZ7_BRALA|nr:TTC28 [Branchiostoma lanceolatum]
MLRVCQKLRAADAKSKRLGLVRTQTDYFRALLDAMADMDRYAEVELLKSLGDVNLEKGRLDKNPEKYDNAMVLYRTALFRCEDADVGESLEYRYHYAEKLRLGKRSTATSSYEPLSSDKKMSSQARVVEKFLHLDHRMTVRGNKEPLLIEYTRLVVEGIVNDDNMLETEAIKSLGDVYLKRGTETRDAPCFTKATALYNTALARCERFQGTVALIHRLLYTARIRQETKTSGYKGPKQRVQQQQGHVTRDFPMTSPNTDVIGDSEGQQSMTYKEYLTKGDRALAAGKLDVAEQNFASGLRLIHNPNKPDRCKEAECLLRLGDVYVQCGKRTKEGRKFTQAAALYNATMARTAKNKHSVTKKLHEIEQWFLRYTANVEKTPDPSDSAVRHQKRLQEMRAQAKSQLDVINEQHNPYQYDEDDPVMITVEAERAEAVKALFKNIAKDRQVFIEDLVRECIAILGPPPCKYAFIGLGSQATELVTPYSDLEFAILIEDGKDNDVTRRYFLNLTHYLHLKVINLGETILPSMAIPSLNDFPANDWFFDSVTPRGFAFDGFMPWASKTPFGRDQTKTKPPVSLIQTPAEMAKFQRLDVSVAEGYHLSDILRRVVFLIGEEALVTEYMTKLKGIITGDLLSCFRSRLSATQILWEIRAQFDTFEPTGQLLNVKKDIYRFPGIAIEVLALCSQIIFASTWDVIDELKEAGKIHKDNASHLTVLTSISAELRLRTYLANGGQRDSMSPLIQMKYQSKPQEVSDTTLSSVFHVPNIQVLFRYYCRAIPLKKCIPDSLQGQPKKCALNTTIIDTSHECRGRISIYLYLFNSAKLHLRAALKDVGSDNIKRVDILHKLGTLWAFFDDCKTGISMHEESLSVCKNIYGDNTAHPAIAGSLNNLGLSWSKLGDHKKAISYYEQSLSMMKTIYGNNTAHPDIAASLNNLGSSWSNLGNLKKAICYYKQSLTMSKTICGGNTAHPLIASTLNNLGTCWNDLGDHRKAISYFDQSFTMKKTIYGDSTAHPDIADSLNNLGMSWNRLGDHRKAIRYYEQSLTIRKVIYGDNTAHLDIAESLNNLGSCWRNLGDYTKAISYHKQSLTMMKTIYGDNTAHPNVAATLNNIGGSWSTRGDHKKAISYYEQSLTMQKIIHEDNTAHSGIAASLNNLGSSWSNLGDHKKAISYYKQSFTMRKTIYGDNTAHPDIADSLNNLGSCWNGLGDHKKAISYYEQSLNMNKAIYGDNTAHPNIAASLNNLGSSWSNLGDHKKAISYYEQSLTIGKVIYGDNTAHPDIAASLNNLGTYWGYLDNDKKAISYFEQSLTMKKTIYGDNTAHPDVATTLNNIGSSWSGLGDHKKAISYHEQSLNMLKIIHDDNTVHPDVAASLDKIGLSWSCLGDHKKAISYFEKSLTIRKTIYGDNTAHPGIATSLNNLGTSWSGLGDHKKAIGYYVQSLSIWNTTYGDNTAHPDTAKSLNNIGSSWGQLSDHKKAISYYEQSLTMMKTTYGDNTVHPDIARALSNIGSSWSKLGDHKKAISYYEQSLTMRKTIYGDNTAHPHTAKSLINLGSSWSELGNHKKAISYYEQSLLICNTIYGDKTAHPHTTESLINLGSSWGQLGDHKKAISYCEQSLTMMKTIYGDNMAHPDTVTILYNLQVAWNKLGNYQRAMEYRRQSQSMQRALNALGHLEL